MTRAIPVAFLIVGVVALSACGDDTEQTAKTVTLPAQTVTVSADVQTPSAADPDDEPSEASTPAEPLPDGVVGADGTYKMDVKSSDYEKENLIVDERSPNRSEWRFATTCRGSSCSIRMMRQLGSGGYKTLTLRPATGRRNVFEGSTTSSDECLADPKTVATRQRYSVRLHHAVDRNGRRTAQRVDVFLTETTTGCTKGTRGVLSWRGALIG